MKKYLLLILISVSFVSGCTWVHLTSEGELVQKVAAEDVEDCKRLGEATVSVKDKVVGIGRSRTKVSGELLILGQNAAAEMGGDTIVPASDIEDGEQTFNVYRCRGER
jgi:uncharacterized protein (DUF4213/DUF364 family)